MPARNVERDQLRRTLRQRRAELPLAQVRDLSAQACRRLANLPCFAAARSLIAYRAVRGELDPASLVRRALADGKQVALPRVVAGGELRWLRFGDEQALETSALGIEEPAANMPEVNPTGVDLIIVPALALDSLGGRLGYGKGYYDRALPGLINAQRVGLVYDFQVVPHIPAQDHDVPMHGIVTESRHLQVRQP